MTMALRQQLKAAEYRTRAQEASALADASPLGHVRAKHEIAAARWRDLAQMNEPAEGALRPVQAPAAGLAPALTGG